MFKGLVSKMFGTHSDRELKALMPLVDQVMAREEEYSRLTKEELQAKTGWLKGRLAAGETLDDILPDAFATAREAAWRVLEMRPYRVQVIGGIVLHQGRIAEMKTGEGKTLVAVLPAYLNALAGKGVHIVTVNDYLARRDSEWMGKVHRYLGLKVGLIVQGMTSQERREAYAADITYGTNSEIGFDYLRDNMAIYKERMVQRGHSFAIVDEVDSILIDEARTPLIISGAASDSDDLYERANDFVSKLKKIVYTSVDEKQEEDEDLDADYVVDEKARTATLTARGTAKAEQFFEVENLSDLENATLSHHINQALRAHGIMKRDVDYVVKDDQVLIVDEFTGRIMYGRRYSEGLHQALEAKENVKVEKETKTQATITYQNFFRLYDKLSGMTGTALTEEEEFSTIYHLDIIEIPTNKPVIRVDYPDVVFQNRDAKVRAIIAQIKACHAKGQPVLVGTVSIEKSEYLSKLLKKEGIRHNVLNAKYHEKEAEIIAQAGKFGAVTIATNMAGRGTDIMLGGNAEYMARNSLKKAGLEEDVIAEATGYAETDDQDVLSAREMYMKELAKFKAETEAEAERVREAGGLFIIGTERHEARRIDNQLRGRSGRQGDPGETRFYIALTDDIMRLFGGERVERLMTTLKADEDTPIEMKMLSNSIESAQRRVESRNFQSRKNVLEYDDVMNQQRNIIYEQRRKVLDGENIKQYIQSMITDVITGTIASECPVEKITTQEELDEAVAPLTQLFLKKGAAVLPAGGCTKEELTEDMLERAAAFYENKEKTLGMLEGTETPVMRELERVILLSVVDEYWMEHIDAMSELRQSVGLRAYGQVNPVDEYKHEGFDMFEAMVNGIREEVVRRIFTVQVKGKQPQRRRVAGPGTAVAGGLPNRQPQVKKKSEKIRPNDPCPCGKLRPNGLPMKYKDCCGRRANMI
ncbi:MAG: preprotein translocase subunit SecA [Oscillospiraceae bacterium]|nr:preprotein translocase subunit SecA [Oscillospiraceae bacterium]MCR5174961.1 preprotein translocase subunit SecA [Oscillospiraceae bacterium]